MGRDWPDMWGYRRLASRWRAVPGHSTITPSIVHNRESEPTFCHHSAIAPEFDVSQLGVFLPQPRLVREGAASIEYSDRDARNRPFLRFQTGRGLSA
jgi:hypothetical protein